MATSRSSMSCEVEMVPLANGTVATAQPYPTCVRVGSYLYVIARLSLRSGGLAYVMPVLDVNAKMWNFVPLNVYFDQGSGVFLYQDRLFIFRHATQQLIHYDLAMNEILYSNTVGEAPRPGPNYSGDFLEKLNRYVLFGGYPLDSDKRVYVLDVPQSRWFKAVEKGTPARTRFQHGSCVHNGLIYIYGGWGRNGRYEDGLFILKVGKCRSVTWSSPLTGGHIGELSSFVFLPVGRILLLCGGMTEDGVNGISYYDTDHREFGKIELRGEQRTLFGSGAAGEILRNGRSIAILGGSNTLESMVQITMTED